MISTQAEIDRLYMLLQLRSEPILSRYGRIPTLRDLHSPRTTMGTKGVYFLFEPGECRSNLAAQRIIRVGSHRSQRASIESRIAEHATDWGRSVFRRHVGTALIRKGDFDAAIQVADRDRWAALWFERFNGWAVHHRRARLHPTLHPLHPIVTRAIAEMSAVWVEIRDQAARLELERQCIRLLSNYLHHDKQVEPPSDTWLGYYALSEKVRKSGLWNVQHVGRPHATGFLDSFQKYFHPAE